MLKIILGLIIFNKIIFADWSNVPITNGFGDKIGVMATTKSTDGTCQIFVEPFNQVSFGIHPRDKLSTYAEIKFDDNTTMDGRMTRAYHNIITSKNSVLVNRIKNSKYMEVCLYLENGIRHIVKFDNTNAMSTINNIEYLFKK